MPARNARAERMAARLSAAGFTTRVTHRNDHICIEVEAQESVAAESWRELLAVLDTADRFGLVVNESGCTAWADINEETPATDATVRGHGRQL